jgi:serine/threonine protein phosphatase PrpC
MPDPFSTCTRHGTHIGHIRRINEDALFVNEREGLWLVADGIGGHGNGEKASRIVVEHVEGYRQSDSIEKCLADIEARLLQANEACRSIPGGGTLGTTVAALLVCQSEACVLWAGDSRTYRLRDGDLTLVTEDHNLAQERCRRGELSQDAAQRLPSANVLTRAVGIHKDLRLEAHIAQIVASDRYLISTDGLYKELPLETIRQMLSGPFNDQILQALIDEALNRGGRDNITGIVVDVGEQP